jgi:membrane-bound metal-dependent hydrolase YbcI (DUF457 family)
MPSPVGHLLSGAAIYLAGRRGRRSRISLTVGLAASILPDFDFVPGIIIGDMRAFHHGVSHSLTFACLLGAVMLVVTRWWCGAKYADLSLLATIAYGTHVILDMVNVNEGTRGVPILWPFSDEQFGFNLRLFGHFRYGDITEGVWSVIRWDNVGPLIRELSVLGVPVLILRHKEQIRHRFFAVWSRIERG